MEFEIQLTRLPIPGKILPPAAGTAGAWLEFRGEVRGEENGQAIAALEYEAYSEMAEREMRRLLNELAGTHPLLAAKVIHRLGVVPVGETAIYVGLAGKHRTEVIAVLAGFMERLKQDVPIWKRRSLSPGKPSEKSVIQLSTPDGPTVCSTPGQRSEPPSLDAAMAEIFSCCQSLAPVRVSLEDSCGRVLRENIFLPEDLPANDRSTRDGYAILTNDLSDSYAVVDTLHAADWRPRELQRGEAVRVATGAVLPCEGVQVVMQEHVKRDGQRIQIMKRESDLNVRRRGEEGRAGQLLVQSGNRLDSGRLALLATAGCAHPLVNPRFRIAHFTTGDEVVPPGKALKPGQIRDSNSILIRGLLQPFQPLLEQSHLPEELERAWKQLDLDKISATNLVLISGGASVGEKDFTAQLLQRLGFKIIISQVNVRPGKPLIFGVDGNRVAFGLPGNPLSHFVCFHFAVATALAGMGGQPAPNFLRGRLATELAETACSRETLWPAALKWNDGVPLLHPLAWASSGDVSGLASANVLIRVPDGVELLAAGRELEFLPVGDMMNA
jgi:molybdopterin molybdotransferase